MTVRGCFESVIRQIESGQSVDFTCMAEAVLYLKILDIIDIELYSELLSLTSNNYEVVMEGSEGILYVTYPNLLKGDFLLYPYEYCDEFNHDEREVDFFNKEELIDAIYNLFHNDRKLTFKKELRGESPISSYNIFLQKYGDIAVPSYIKENINEFKKIAYSAKIINKKIYYIQSIDRKWHGNFMSCEIDKIKKDWKISDGEIVIEKTGKGMVYVPFEDAIYVIFPFPFTKIYYRYDLREKNVTTIRNIQLAGLKSEEELVLLKTIDDVTDVVVKNKSTERIVYKDIRDTERLEVLPNRIIVYSSYYCRNIEMPFELSEDGEKKHLQKGEYAYCFWKNFLKSYICRNNYRFLRDNCGISEFLKRREVEQAPSELTIRWIRKRLDEIASMKMIETGRYFPVNSLLKLLSKIGFDEDEDITELVFNLIKYSKLCNKNELYNTDFWDKFFYFTLYRISKEKNFKDRLVLDIDNLFRKEVYWTEERLTEYKTQSSLPKIAIFDVIDHKLVLEKQDVNNGEVEGDFVKPIIKNEYRGYVAYNYIDEYYMIYWESPELELLTEVKEKMGTEDILYRYKFETEIE